MQRLTTIHSLARLGALAACAASVIIVAACGGDSSAPETSAPSSEPGVEQEPPVRERGGPLDWIRCSEFGARRSRCGRSARSCARRDTRARSMRSCASSICRKRRGSSPSCASTARVVSRSGRIASGTRPRARHRMPTTDPTRGCPAIGSRSRAPTLRSTGYRYLFRYRADAERLELDAVSLENPGISEAQLRLESPLFHALAAAPLKAR